VYFQDLRSRISRSKFCRLTDPKATIQRVVRNGTNRSAAWNAAQWYGCCASVHADPCGQGGPAHILVFSCQNGYLAAAELIAKL
jgi:hypothetical protein